MTPHRFSLAAALSTIFLATVIVSSVARGQTTEWQNSGSGSWFDSDNWTLGVPSNTKNAEINNGGTAQISATADARNVYLGRNLNSSGSLYVGSVLDSLAGYVGHTGSGTATVQGANSIWTTSGDLRVGYQGTGQLNVTSGGDVNSASGLIGDIGGATGVVTVNGAGSKWTNAGELRVGNQGTGALSITGGGAVENSRGYIGLQGGSAGTVTVTGAGSSWTNNLDLLVGIDGSGAMNITGGGAVSSPFGYIGLNNGSSSTVIVDGVGSIWTNSVQLVLGYYDDMSDGIGTLSVQNGGVVSAAGGMSIGPHSTVLGNGTIVGNVINSGAVAPGTSPGTLHIDGPYTQNAGAILQIELASAGSYDKLDVLNNAAFGGTLKVSLIGGYTPVAGSSFNILDWGSRSGTFSSIQLPTLGPGLTWEPSQLYISGLLSVVSAGVAGDYNEDNIVDAADYILWRKHEGTNNSLANDPLGGIIGQPHYDQWRSNFGQTAGSGAALPSAQPLSAAVPEPSSFALWAVAMFAAAKWIRRILGRRDRRPVH